jgi:hypothetical protein
MIQQAVNTVISSHASIICERVRQKWGNLSGIVGNAKIDFSQPKLIGDIIVATLSANGQKAWIAEYGRGSLMESTAKNPYLAEYISSSVYNYYRKEYGTNIILGRDAGIYTDLDGNPHSTAGKMAGKIVEGKGRTQPISPMYVIMTEIGFELNNIMLDLSNAVGHAIANSIAGEV